MNHDRHRKMFLMVLPSLFARAFTNTSVNGFFLFNTDFTYYRAFKIGPLPDVLYAAKSNGSTEDHRVSANFLQFRKRTIRMCSTGEPKHIASVRYANEVLYRSYSQKSVWSMVLQMQFSMLLAEYLLLWTKSGLFWQIWRRRRFIWTTLVDILNQTLGCQMSPKREMLEVAQKERSSAILVIRSSLSRWTTAFVRLMSGVSTRGKGGLAFTNLVITQFIMQIHVSIVDETALVFREQLSKLTAEVNWLLSWAFRILSNMKLACRLRNSSKAGRHFYSQWILTQNWAVMAASMKVALTQGVLSCILSENSRKQSIQSPDVPLKRIIKIAMAFAKFCLVLYAI